MRKVSVFTLSLAGLLLVVGRAASAQELRADESTVGLVGTARYQAPIAGLRWYGSGGAGLYRSRVGVGSPLPGLSGRHDDLDASLGVHAETGLSLPVSPDTELGLSLRRVWLRSDFGSAAGGAAEAGGNFIFLGLRYAR